MAGETPPNHPSLGPGVFEYTADHPVRVHIHQDDGDHANCEILVMEPGATIHLQILLPEVGAVATFAFDVTRLSEPEAREIPLSPPVVDFLTHLSKRKDLS